MLVWLPCEWKVKELTGSGSGIRRMRGGGERRVDEWRREEEGRKERWEKGWKDGRRVEDIEERRQEEENKWEVLRRGEKELWEEKKKG